METEIDQDLIGRIIGGRFEIVRLIGTGGMGAVFEARHQTLPRKFAIKILKPELSRSRDFVERFRREAIAAGRIEHPNVVYITDFGHMNDGSLYLVMEYLEGIGLDDVLARNIRLPLSRAIPILAQVADALDAAHQVQVVHRDLKPENILLTEMRGRQDVVKIFDFGIARVHAPEFEDELLTARGQVFGTAEYMSPEQATGDECDGRSDIYALGCLAYELVTGDPPFVGQPVKVLQAHVSTPAVAPSTRMRNVGSRELDVSDTLRIRDSGIPPALDALVLRCLAKEPRERYQTCAELRQDLLKVRGLLYSMGAEIASRRRASGEVAVLSERHMTEGWRSLGGQMPEVFSTGNEDPVVVVSRQGFTTSQAAARNDRIDLDELYGSYHDVLRQLGIALVQAVLAPSETSEELERLLAVEEEMASLTGTIALAEQNFDRIRYEFGQQEKRLRYAIFDLTMERAQLEGRSKVDPDSAAHLHDQVADLNFQIGELTRRTEEISSERAQHIQDLDREVRGYRDLREELEQEAAEIYQKLHSQVEALRPAAKGETVQELYARLDDVRSRIEQSR